MPEFRYNARDHQGVARSGAISAPSRTSAASQLRERGWVVLEVDADSSKSEDKKTQSILAGLPPRSIHVEVSLQQLAMMLRSGMTLLESIGSVISQTPSQSLTNSWRNISSDVQRGKGLADSMQKHKCFPSFASRLVKVGERTGNLSVVLTRAAETMKHRRMARESFVSATIYPVLVVLLSLVVTAYMIVYLIPRLETYLSSLGRELPAMTQSLIHGSLWLRANYQILVVGVLFVTVATALVYATKEGRTIIDRTLVRVPLTGRLLRLGETSTFARGLSMMLKSGITVTDGMLAVQNTLGNYHLRDTVGVGREKLIRGATLVDSLNQKHAFTPLLVQMISVGEKSGDLAGVLDEVALMSDQQFKSAVKRVNAVITPALTLVIGAIVGYVYIAFFMALVAAGS